MNNNLDYLPQTYQNVMEILVKEEIEKQLKSLPVSRRPYINRVEVATYALNRLPAMYASSQKGKIEQRRVGLVKYKAEIIIAVRRAIAIVDRDPLRSSNPLISETEVKYRNAETALQDLKYIFQKYQIINQNELSWDKAVMLVERILSKIYSKSADKQDAHPTFHNSNPNCYSSRD
jgi:hypothetical protein